MNKEVEKYLEDIKSCDSYSKLFNQLIKFTDDKVQENKLLQARILEFRSILQADERKNEFMYTAYQSMLKKYDEYFEIKSTIQGTIKDTKEDL